MAKTGFQVRAERWPMKSPFRISGKSFTHAELVVVELSETLRQVRIRPVE